MSGSVVVVGYCASGKSSVVKALRRRGFQAEAVAQEHSAIDELWDHHQPDIVIFLDVSLDQIRNRRGNPRWPGWIYDLQTERLTSARRRADLVVDTSTAGLEAVISEVTRFLTGGER